MSVEPYMSTIARDLLIKFLAGITEKWADPAMLNPMPPKDILSILRIAKIYAYGKTSAF